MNKNILFKKLLTDDEYFLKVFPNITENDFDKSEYKNMLKVINTFFTKYKKKPNIDEMILYLDTQGEFHKSVTKSISESLKEVKDTNIEDYNSEFLVEATEKFIKNERFKLLIEDSIRILEGDSKKSLEEIQEEIKTVTQLSFQSSMGHDYILDSRQRFLKYGQRDERQAKCNIDIIDASGFGSPKKLSIYLAGSNVGKCWTSTETFKIYGDDSLIEDINKFLKEKYEE